ncbi:MAG: hypothetical protein EXR94_07890 [Gemmatimonadetes bacterium]|nr:hypothetical protein [Gemmatimonadota bacterium]
MSWPATHPTAGPSAASTTSKPRRCGGAPWRASIGRGSNKSQPSASTPAATAKTLAATKAFHDAILQSGHLPVELVRAGLMKQPPRGDFEPSWRFAGF